MIPSNHLILCHPLLLLPSIFPSIKVFFKESVLRIRGPKCWCFKLSICPSNEHPGLISFRIDWFDLLVVHRTLKRLLQYHSSKASVLLLSIFPSIRVFSNESALCMRWPKYWSFSFSISPSSEYLGLISFRIDWFDLLVVQRTLKSLLQHHSSKTLFMCFKINSYGPTFTSIHTIGKTTALTIWTFISKVVSLILNMLSRFVIAFLPRSKRL